MTLTRTGDTVIRCVEGNVAYPFVLFLGTSNGSAVIDLRVPRDPTLVATVRRFVGDLCLRVLGDPDVTSRVVVAAHELFDNAIRHASEGESQLHVAVSRVGVGLDEGEIVLATANAIASDRESVLATLLEEIAASADRCAFYQSLLKRVGRSDVPVGLGLGRIHAEAELDITGGVTDGVVRIAARGRFPLRVVPR